MFASLKMHFLQAIQNRNYGEVGGVGGGGGVNTLQRPVPPVPPSRDNTLNRSAQLEKKLQQLVPPSRDNTPVTCKLSWRKTLAKKLQQLVPPVPPSRDNTFNR
jgi:hypothetical protein